MTRAMLVIVFAFSAANSSAQDRGNSLINPFKRTNPNGSVQIVKKKPGLLPKMAMPKLPKLPKLPNFNPFIKKTNQPPVTPARPNWLHSIGSGTKGFFEKTTHALTPWHKPKQTKGKAPIVPAFMQSSNKKQDTPSRTPLINWLPGPKERQKTETPSDFFRQDRGSLPPIVPIPEK